jgi:hypothetical protein
MEEDSRIIMHPVKKKRVTTSKSGQSYNTRRPPISGKNFMKMNMNMLQSASNSRHLLGSNAADA